MRGKIHAEWHHGEINEQIGPTGDGVLLVEKQAPSPVYVALRAPEIVDRDDDPRHQRLQLPSSRIVSKPPDRPQKQRRRNDVKEAEQANG